MIFAGIQILGEFLEGCFKQYFDTLKQKQKELGVRLPDFPKPLFRGSTKTVQSLKSRPGTKSGDNVLLIQFSRARISDYTFGSIQCAFVFNIYVSVKHFMVLANITDVIMKLHNAPLNIEEYQNVFTEKGYVKPKIHVLKAYINNIECLDQLKEASISDAYRFLITVTFETHIEWTPNLKLGDEHVN